MPNIKSNNNSKVFLIYIVITFFFVRCFDKRNEWINYPIQLDYGLHQEFKYRQRDINILGRVDRHIAVTKSVYILNDGAEERFYVKGSDPQSDRLSRNRLQQKGSFNIEVPICSENLRSGVNELTIIISDSLDSVIRLKMNFLWDPSPVRLPINLSDLKKIRDIQEIGQAVNGKFIIDYASNSIRIQEPVGKDFLFLIGSPFKSQEAVYSVRFSALKGPSIGLSDFFVGHETVNPDIGIKPGWSTAGLATIRSGSPESARIWIAWGDLLNSPQKWVVKTEPQALFNPEIGKIYRVRHQVVFKSGVDMSRFKIWSIQEAEPLEWLCHEDDRTVPDDKIKHTRASFGLFQNQGQPTEWFNIQLRSIEDNEIEKTEMKLTN